MKRSLLTLSAFAVVLMLTAPSAFAMHTTLTADDAITMWRSGARPADIIQAVQRNGAYAPLTRNDLIRMEEAGLPSALIRDLDRTFSRSTTGYGPAYRVAPRFSAYGPYDRFGYDYGYGYPYSHSPFGFSIGIGVGHGGFGYGGFGHGYGFSYGGFGHGGFGHGGHH